MDYNNSLNRFLTSLPERYEIANSNEAQINAVLVDIDVNTGYAVSIKRINGIRKEIDEVKSQ